MELTCPKCGDVIASDDVNMAKDVALCRTCNQAFKPSQMGLAPPGEPVDLDRPPPGCAFQRTPDGFELSASIRSRFTLLIFGGSLFGGVFIIIIGLLMLLGRFPPGASPDESGAMRFAGTFLAAGGAFSALFHTLILAFAATKVVVVKGRGRVRTGLGPFAKSAAFDWNAVTAVMVTVPAQKGPVGQQKLPQILLAGPSPVAFGGPLSDERREFVLRALQQLLAQRQ